MHPILFFIIVFIIINYTFGIIQFLINPMSMNFLDFSKDKSLISNMKIFTRIVKFNADFAILTMLLLFLKDYIPSHIIGLLLFVECVFIFSYQIYYHTIKKLYNTQPNFYMDNKLLQLGFQVVYYGYRLYFFLGIFVIALIFVAYYFATQYFAQLITSATEPLTIIGILTIVPFGAVFLLLLKKRNMWGYPKMRFYFTSLMVYNNFKDSIDTHFLIQKFKQKKRDNKSIDSNIELDKKPNLVILFLESYGKILYEKYAEGFKPLSEELENKLQKNGFHISSNLSKSPRFGGGSWMCYSSFLYGMEVENEGLFRIILEKDNAAYFNSSILKILQQNDYENYLLNPLTGFKNLKINWQEIKDLFFAKEIIKFEDLSYKGKVLGALGLQPPDQFSLNRGFEILSEKNEGAPYSLFFETLNSHAKWESPLNVEKNWKDYNQANYSFPISKMGNESYFPAIHYQISMTIDFILNNIGENTNIMIMGDHQPPLVTHPNSGNETPIHIISKDKAFLKHFEEYGFENGLWVNDLKENNVSHPGMYYAMLRSLAKEYGKEGTVIPDYLPNGVKLG